MRTLSALSMLSILAVSTQAKAEEEPSTPHISLALERVASAQAMFFSIDEDGDELGLRTKGITAGGPLQNPLGAPRLAFDYLSSSGLTLGTGLAFGLGDFDSRDNGDIRDEGGYSLLMLNPRVGYRFALGKVVDLTPRLGATFGWASITGPEYQNCDVSFDGETSTESCSQEDGDKVKLFAAMVNAELLAAWRLTDSFNLLTGLSYDMLVAAHAKAGEGGGDSSESEREDFDKGHLSSLQFWLGLGGYL